MSFHIQDEQNDDSIMSEINMTPMVDVMLVLLIIFIITLPVIQQAVKVELPKANSVRNEVKPESFGIAHLSISKLSMVTLRKLPRRIRNQKLICAQTNQ